MTAHRDPDRLIHAFFKEGLEELPDPVYDEVRAQVEQTRQRAFFGPWRTPDVSRYLRIGLAAAVVVIVAVLGYTLLPGLGVGGPGATPSPSPSLIARGAFVEHDWGQVEFVATRAGSSVSGRMTIAERDGFPGTTVDLHCARETEDGLIMIGGTSTDDAGTLAGIALQRGSPDHASVNYGSAAQETDCLAYLDAWLQFMRGGGYTIPLLVLDGGVEFGP